MLVLLCVAVLLVGSSPGSAWVSGGASRSRAAANTTSASSLGSSRGSSQRSGDYLYQRLERSAQERVAQETSAAKVGRCLGLMCLLLRWGGA